MRKNVFGRQFKRDANERKSLFRGLVSSLVLHERIKTTEQKAKSIKSRAEKLITTAKKGEKKARYLLQGEMPKKIIDKVVLDLAPRFENRQGGYTRIIKIGRRFSDDASMVFMEWTEQKQTPVAADSGQTSKVSSKTQPKDKKGNKKTAKVSEKKTKPALKTAKKKVK